MKRSELKMSGEIYRLTPDCWGDNSIMVDEDVVQRVIADIFGVRVDECDPDEQGETLAHVELATDAVGDTYAVRIPEWTGGSRNRKINGNIYCPCEKMSEMRDGTLAMFGPWIEFENEDE